MTERSSQSDDALKYEDWGGEMGARWLANLDGFEKTIAPVGDALLAQAAYMAGERVLDIGCGGGATSMAIARTVAPDGEVLGVDISPDLVAASARRAGAAGLANAQFQCADAASVVLPNAPYDRMFSRFGSMFFADPVGAFTHLRSLVKPGGRIDLAVWGPPLENPWMVEGMAVVRRYVDVPGPAPRSPGPFAFEDRDYLSDILDSAGFTQVEIVANKGKLAVSGPGGTPEQAQRFVCNAMAFGQILLAQPENVQRPAIADLINLYTRHHRAGEGVMMNYSAWLVSALA